VIIFKDPSGFFWFSFSADLGGSSQYSNEKFERWSGESFRKKV